jgi:hypothetical protein
MTCSESRAQSALELPRVVSPVLGLQPLCVISGVNHMTSNPVMLDAFAEARKTWDDLVSLQPDIYAGGGNLHGRDLAEFARRVNAHQASVDALAEALRMDPAEETPSSRQGSRHPGISNRESAADEAKGRQQHPPLDAGSPAPQDAAGREGEQPLADTRDRHTSHKAGSRSIAQKEAASRYPDRSMPASRKVAGAFGREPKG